LLLLAVVENFARNTEHRGENYGLLARSRFTIPVSVVAGAHNEELMILPVLRRLLAFDYPEFEVILVNDGSTDRTLDVLKEAFQLERREVFYRRVLPCADVRMVYRSRVDPRLVVVDKVKGGKADAINCGINFARYRYLCGVDADTAYARDALLRAMRVAVKDPGRVISLTSHFTPSSAPTAVELDADGLDRIDRRLLVNFQRLEYLRSFLNSRLAWSRRNFMLCTPGGFMIWRRDVVEEIGGFSPKFTCEDIEITFRAHEKYRRERREYRIVALPETAAHTEGPSRIPNLMSQRARWQRVIMETVWHYRRMFANPRYGFVGVVGVPYFALYEVAAPAVEVLALLLVPLAWALGLLSASQLWLAVGTLAFANATLTTGGVLMQDIAHPSYRVRDLALLILLGPLEFLVYRPVVLVARCYGVWGFFRGRKDWVRFERNGITHRQ
jgi:cellulose synthase/poly-beta-1,6-N-acetylglucosamine synthase-like glycosyltransferase